MVKLKIVGQTPPESSSKTCLPFHSSEPQAVSRACRGTVDMIFSANSSPEKRQPHDPKKRFEDSVKGSLSYILVDCNWWEP